MSSIDPQLVQHIASLANISLLPGQDVVFAQGFTKTLDVVEKMNAIDTHDVEETNQVTELENIFRDDVCTPDRMFTQSAALANGPRTHNGYFVVNGILEES